MATQKCPKCKSGDIRQGYRSTPLLLKLAFLYNLLCENCNWEFKGFAIPGTVPRKMKKKKNIKEINQTDPVFINQTKMENNLQPREILEFSKKPETKIEPQLAPVGAENILNILAPKQKNKVKKKVRVKLH